MAARTLKSQGFRTLVVFALLLGSPRLMAQQAAGAPALEPRETIGTILMAGLVGGILGLSTLSFYDKPQDNIRNISIGAGIGMIAAAIYMTYNVAQIPPPAGTAELGLPGAGSSQWALVPDWDPRTAQAKASYVLRF